MVSSEGLLTMWDLSEIPSTPPTAVLLTQPMRVINIKSGAIGHLHQAPDVVVYSLGKAGFHIHDKFNGALLGKFPPPNIPRKNIFHIKHPAHSPHLSRVIEKEQADDISALSLSQGPIYVFGDDVGPFVPIEQDEWGACNVDGPYLVGISRGGRVMICSDWESVLQDSKRLEECLAIIEIDPEAGSNFDLGGWLNLKFGRVIFEVTYVIHQLWW